MSWPTVVDVPDSTDGRRPWIAPRLTPHESLTVLTQNVLGATAVVLLQGISCGPSGCGTASPNIVPAQNPTVQPGGAGQPRP